MLDEDEDPTKQARGFLATASRGQGRRRSNSRGKGRRRPCIGKTCERLQVHVVE